MKEHKSKSCDNYMKYCICESADICLLWYSRLVSFSHVVFLCENFKMSSAPTAAELISVGGERTTGESVRTQNGKPQLFFFAVVAFLLLSITLFLVVLSVVMAVSAIANIVKSSLGPVGLDKMLVDDVGVSILWQK